jgi:MFS superfamily sulfate permease-like transporter
VLLFLTGPLPYVPIAALGAILISASLSLLDLKTLAVLYRLDRLELALALLATFGVIWVGALQAILVVVALALLRFVYLSARPQVEVLGKVEGLPGFHSITRHPGATTEPGLVLFRFNAPLVFFNAPHFKHQALAAIHAAGPDLKWFVLDAMPITSLDYTGYAELQDLAETCASGAPNWSSPAAKPRRSSCAGPRGSPRRRLFSRQFPTLRQAVKAYRSMFRAGEIQAHRFDLRWVHRCSRRRPGMVGTASLRSTLLSR